jgi:hypothetical protein
VAQECPALEEGNLPLVQELDWVDWLQCAEDHLEQMVYKVGQVVE